MNEIATPVCDEASIPLAGIMNSTASKMTQFVPLDVAQGLEQALRKSANEIERLKREVELLRLDKQMVDWLAVPRLPDRRKYRKTVLGDKLLLSYLVDGLPLKQIETKLNLSKSQVAWRMTQLYKEYKVAGGNRIELLVKAGRLAVV